MGHPGDDATDPLIDKAYAAGIIFTTANTALPKAEEKYASDGMGYVGAPNHAAGYALGAEAAKRGGIKKGDLAFVWGLKGQGGDRGSRTVGVIELSRRPAPRSSIKRSTRRPTPIRMPAPRPLSA